MKWLVRAILMLLAVDEAAPPGSRGESPPT
jgi:hypothetical protein